MKLNKENKRGISLIVLVITIIVMIILAAAIILSLNSSGIIGKANEATSKSDAANLKEAASIKLAEYELKKQLGELEDPDQTASEYVKEKLQGEMDTSGLAITPEGEILTGLTEIAVKFAEAGVKIGAEVTGYVLNTATTAKTYSTSGNENTCIYDEEMYEYSEGPAAPTTLTRDEDITWQYIGIDENGEARIVGSVTGTSPTINISGKGGYLNGPQELKKACKVMYSSNMGVATSITLEDVIKVLEYTGEMGSYIDSLNAKYTPTKEILTIGEIISKNDEPELSPKITPDGKEINEYKANYIKISKFDKIYGSDDTSEYNVDRENIIFPSTENKGYWLASEYAEVSFRNRCADYGVFEVSASSSFIGVGGAHMYDSAGWTMAGATSAIRPVVSLSSNINMSYANGVVTLSE